MHVGSQLRVEQHRELAAAEPGHDIAIAAERAQPRGDRHRQRVAGTEAHRGLDLMHARHIERQHAE